MGVVYMLLTRFALKGEKQDKTKDGWKRRTFRDLIKQYRLAAAPAVWPFVPVRQWSASAG